MTPAEARARAITRLLDDGFSTADIVNAIEADIDRREAINEVLGALTEMELENAPEPPRLPAKAVA